MLFQACSTLQNKPLDTSEALLLQQQHLTQIAKINTFSMKARIGIQTEGKGFSGNLDWQHQSEIDKLNIFSPLGSQMATIEKNAHHASITDAKGQTTITENLSELTSRTLGFELPLSGLSDWTLGRPTNAAITHAQYNELGQLVLLKQLGWEIHYGEYNKQLQPALPSKLTLRNDKLHLKLIIENWQTVAQ